MLGAARAFDAVPFFWSQHYDVPINYVGHAEKWDEHRDRRRHRGAGLPAALQAQRAACSPSPRSSATSRAWRPSWMERDGLVIGNCVGIVRCRRPTVCIEYGGCLTTLRISACSGKRPSGALLGGEYSGLRPGLLVGRAHSDLRDHSGRTTGGCHCANAFARFRGRPARPMREQVAWPRPVVAPHWHGVFGRPRAGRNATSRCRTLRSAMATAELIAKNGTAVRADASTRAVVM